MKFLNSSGDISPRPLNRVISAVFPTFWIAEEPTGNLDPDTAWEIMKLLEQINLRGTTILMVTHAKDIVDKMGKRVIAIDKGCIVRDDATGSYGAYEDERILTRVFTGGVFDNNAE